MKSSSEVYLLVNITIPMESVDEASSALYEFYPNGIWEEEVEDGQVIMHVYFGKEISALDILQKELKKLFQEYKIEFSNTEWNPNDNSWRQYFSPFEIVPDIIISPSWENYQPEQNKNVITLDPGMAFGTGLHPTTKLCAKAIYKIVKSKKDAFSLLDVGCGSGILTLVANKLGIENLSAVEIDEVAAGVAKENLELNDVKNIEIYKDLRNVPGQYDIVVANILLNTLIDIHDSLIRLVKPNGNLILSGITKDQRQLICQKYSADVNIKDVLEMDEWLCLVLKRRS